MLSTMAQWDRLGIVAVGNKSNMIGINPYRHQFHFHYEKKILGFRF